MLSGSTFFAYQAPNQTCSTADFNLTSVVKDWDRWCKVDLILICNDLGQWIPLKELAPNGFNSIEDLKDFYANHLFHEVKIEDDKEKCITQALYHFHQAGFLVATKLFTQQNAFRNLIDHNSCPQKIFLRAYSQGVTILEQVSIETFGLMTERVKPKMGLDYHGRLETYSHFSADRIEVQKIEADFPNRTLDDAFRWPMFVQRFVNFLRSLFGYTPINFYPTNNPLLLHLKLQQPLNGHLEPDQNYLISFKN